MSRFSMYSYAWDIAEEGASNFVSKLQEIGINSITLATSYHAGKFFRPKSKINKIYFPEDGTIYFKHNSSKYGEIKPIPNSNFGSGEILSELTKTKSLVIQAWMVLFHNSQLGSKYQEYAVRNAFEDPYIYALCPAAPQVREYALALMSDIADNYAIQGISVESIGYPPFEHGYHHEMSFVKPNVWLSQNLGLCFCRYCIKGAEAFDIDAHELKIRVAKRIHNYLEDEIDYTPDMASAFWLADVEGDIDLKRFVEYRKNVVTTLAGEIRAAIRPEVEFAIIPSVARPTSGAWYEGTDLAELAKTTGVIEACFYEPSVDRIRADLIDIKERTHNVGKIKGILRPAYPDLTSESSVSQAVSTLWHGGVKDIAFYNYGHFRSQSLNWISSALDQVKHG